MSETQLADQLQGLAQTALADDRLDDATLSELLRFVAKVAQVVEQAFEEVYASLLDLQYLKPSDLQEPRRTELLLACGGVLDRSLYRDAEEICSRLHHLSETYIQTLGPKLNHLGPTTGWPQVMYLLNKHEGMIVELVRDRVEELRTMLDGARSSDLPAIRERASAAKNEMAVALRVLWKLRNDIFGLSGGAGLLELLHTGDRDVAVARGGVGGL